MQRTYSHLPSYEDFVKNATDVYHIRWYNQNGSIKFTGTPYTNIKRFLESNPCPEAWEDKHRRYAQNTSRKDILAYLDKMPNQCWVKLIEFDGSWIKIPNSFLFRKKDKDKIEILQQLSPSTLKDLYKRNRRGYYGYIQEEILRLVKKDQKLFDMLATQNV